MYLKLSAKCRQLSIDQSGTKSNLVDLAICQNIGSMFVLWSNGLLEIETVSADGRSARPARLGGHPHLVAARGGGDMEIQKAYLKYNLVTSSVCLRHN